LNYKKGDPNCMTSEQAMKNITVLYKTNKPVVIKVKDGGLIHVHCEDKPEGFEGW
jgi:hypothetical protein